MDLSNDLVSQFAKITTGDKDKNNETTVYGTVKVYDGITCVKIDGSDLLTPVDTTTEVKEGERVTVLIKNHSAVITGNTSDPSAGLSTTDGISENVTKVTADIGEFKELTTENFRATNAAIDNLTAKDAQIENLVATKASIEELEAVQAKIKDLDVEFINAEMANINDALIQKADIKDLEASNANIKELQADTARIDEALITKADVTALEATWADIDSIEVDIAEIDTALIGKATIEDLNAVRAEISDLDVAKLEATVADINLALVNKANIEDLEASQADIEKLQADTAKIDEALINKANISDLNATNAKIDNLNVESLRASVINVENALLNKADVNDLNAVNASIDNLEADVAEIDEALIDKANISDLDVTNANVKQLQADVADLDEAIIYKASINDLNAANANIQDLTARVGTINNAMIGKASIEELEAVEAKIEDLDVDVLRAEVADIEQAMINKANVADLNAANADIDSLNTQVANIQTLVGGNLTMDNMQSLNLTSSKVTVENAFIKDAMIDSVTANKLISGSIDTNKVTIKSADGSMTLTGSVQQFKDENGKVRIQIGKDSGGNFSFVLYDSTGNGVLIDEDGIKSSNAIADGLIVDSKVANNANISGSKLNIASVISAVNNDNSTTIKSNKIFLDEQNQSLEVAFNSLKTQVETIQDITIDGDLSSVMNQVQSNTTQINVNKGNISTLTSENTIRKEEIKDLDDNIKSVSTSMNDKYTSLQQDLSGFKTTVGNTYTTKSEFNNLGVGARNILLGTSQKITITGYNTTNQTSDLYTFHDPSKYKKATLSVRYKYSVSEGATGTMRVQTDGIYNSNKGETKGYWKQFHEVIDVSTNPSGIVTNVITMDASDIHGYNGVDLRMDNFNGTVTIEEMMLVEGNVRITSWTPAPEDVQGEIDAVNDNLTANYSTTSAMNSAITQKANEITNTVSQTYTTKTEFSNLDVGGRNYITNSAFINGSTSWILAENVSIDTSRTFNGHPTCKTAQSGLTTNSWRGCICYSLPTLYGGDFKAGETYTISCWYYVEDATTIDGLLRLEMKGKKTDETSERNLGSITKTTSDLVQGVWTKLSTTITLSYDVKDCCVRAWVEKNGTAWFADFKMEKGNKATDWTPAPEDVQGEIDKVTNNLTMNYSTTAQMNSAITQKANEITNTVSQTYTTKTEFNNLQVGGKNMIANSSPTSLTNWSGGWDKSLVDCATAPHGKAIRATATAVNPGGGIHKQPIGLKTKFVNGANYTVSAWIRASKPMIMQFRQELFGVDNYINVTTEWQRFTFSHSVDISQTYSSNTFYIQSHKTSIAVGDWFEVHSLKLEKGDKATDWTPAPEDVDDKIYDVESKIQQTADAWTATFASSGGYNLIRNSTGSNKSTNQWTIPHGDVTFIPGMTDSPTGSPNRYYLHLKSDNTSERYAYSTRFRLKPNTTYRFTGYFHNYTACKSFDVFILGSSTIGETDGSFEYDNAHIYKIIADQNTNGAWKKYSVTFTTSAGIRTGYLRIDHNGYNSSGANTSSLHWSAISLTQGEAEVPWSPHPDEVYSGITTIDATGIRVEQTGYSGYTQMSANGFYVNDGTTDAVKITKDGAVFTGKMVVQSGSTVPTSVLSGKVTSGQLDSAVTSDISTAKSNASTALSTANTAKSTADTANTNANTAKTNASTALSTANTAKSTADAANTNANTAKTNASTALSTANTAKSTADTVKSTVDAGKTNWNNAYNRVSEWAYGAVTGSTTIDGGLIQANTVLANKIALSDFTNYSQLNEMSASNLGFTISREADGVWYSYTPVRDKFISEFHSCAGFETFRIQYSISTTCMAYVNSSATSATYVGTAIGLYCCDGTKKSIDWKYATRVTATSSGTATQVTSTITIPSGTRYFKVFIQTEAASNFSGTIKVKNVLVTRMNSGELIVDGAISTNKLAANAVTAAKISAGAISTDKLAANAVTAAKISAGAITADKIAAYAITADKVATGAINADKIEICDFTNYCVRSYNSTMTNDKGQSVSAYDVSKINHYPISKEKIYGLVGGEQFRVKCKIRCGATADSIVFSLVWRDDDDSLLTNSSQTFNGTANSITSHNGILTLPARPNNAAYCSIKMYTNNTSSGVKVSDVIITRMSNGELIVDGSITAGKIASNAVTTDKLNANAVTAAKISSGAITADKISSGAITSDKVAAGAITAKHVVIADSSNILIASPSENPYGDTVYEASDGSKYFKFGDDTTKNWYKCTMAKIGKNVSVKTTDKFRLIFRAYATLAVTIKFIWRLSYTDNTYRDIIQYRIPITTSSTVYEIEIPANYQEPYYTKTVKSSEIFFEFPNTDLGYAYVKDASLVRKSAGDLIVDGSITAGKISSNAVTTDKLNANAVTAAKIASSAITADKISSGVITTDKLAANAITADKISSNAITADKISSNAVTSAKIASSAITADKIAAGSITTSKLAVKDGTNYAQLTNQTASQWGWTKQENSSDEFNCWYQKNALGRDTQISEYYPCKGGESLRVKADIFTSVYGQTQQNGTATATAMGVTIMIFTQNTNNGRSYIAAERVTAASTSGTTKSISSVITLPAEARRFAVYVQINGYPTFSGTLRVRNVIVNKMSSGELIVDGSITANKIAAGAITANKIAAGAITADMINGGTLSAADEINFVGGARIFGNEGALNAGLTVSAAGITLSGGSVNYLYGSWYLPTGNLAIESGDLKLSSGCIIDCYAIAATSISCSSISSSGNISTSGNLDCAGVIYGQNNLALARGSLWAPVGSATRDYLRFGSHILSSDSSYGVLLTDTGGSWATVRCGSVIANGTTLSSDIRLKTDIKYVNIDAQSIEESGLASPNVNLTTEDMHSFIETLPMASYRLKHDVENGIDKTYYGFIAQDILYTKVGSELIEYDVVEVTPPTKDEEGNIIEEGVYDDKGLKYSENKFIAFICGALQEEIKQRKKLEQEVMSLKEIIEKGE